MSLLELRQEIEKLLRDWLKEKDLKVDKIPISKPPKKEFGEFSTTLPFRLSGQLNKAPFEIAREIVREIKPSGLIEKIVAVAPGYVNFYANFNNLAKRTIELLIEQNSNFGRLDIGKGKKVQVEYTSVNPNKALHIGHARNVCLGAALANILEFAGYKVERVNYINDAGSQMAEIMLGFLELGFPLEKENVRFDQYCGDEVYVKVSRLIEKDERLAEKKKEVARKIEEVGSEVHKKTREIAERVLREQLKTCWRLHAEFDVLVWETDILGVELWEKAFELLKNSDLVVYETEGPNKGCWVVKLTKTQKYSSETDKVLVRSDGTKTYVAKDISFAMWKLGLLPSPFKYKLFVTQPSGRKLWTTVLENGESKNFGNADVVINVIDIRQRRLQDTIKIVLSSIYGEEYGQRYIHYGYEVVSLSKRTMERYLGAVTNRKFEHMSGRRGIYINVDPMLDFMKKKAKEESKKRNPNLSEEEIEKIAEKIAVASLKYPLLSADLDKIVIFDVDRALDITEESGSYILYGYARAKRILEKAQTDVDMKEFDPRMLKETEEKELIRLISSFPLVIKECAENLQIKPLAKFMYELTLYFNKFYEKCPVLVKDPEIRENRLILVKSYVKVMEILGQLLAIPLVDRM